MMYYSKQIYFPVKMLFKIAYAISVVSCATVGVAISSDPALSHMAAAVAAHPEWNTSPTTIFVGMRTAANAASLASGDAGFVSVASAIDFSITSAYNVYNSKDSPQKIVYDNYNPGTNQWIHVRFGLADTTVARIINADNGFIFVTNLAILPPAPLSATLPFQGCGAFMNALTAAGLASALEGAKDLTIYAPNDAAMAAYAASSNYRGYSESQRAAVLLYHVVTAYFISTGYSPTQTVPTLLEGNSLTIATGQERITVGRSAHVTLSDTFTIPGIIHTIDQVLIPPTMPAANAVITPVGIKISAPVTPGTNNTKIEPAPTDKSTKPNAASSNMVLASVPLAAFVMNLL